MKSIIWTLFIFFTITSNAQDVSCESARRILSSAFNYHYTVKDASPELIYNAIIHYAESEDSEKVVLTDSEFKDILSDAKKNKRAYTKLFYTEKDIKKSLYGSSLNIDESSCVFLEKAYKYVENGKQRYEDLFFQTINALDKMERSKSYIQKKINFSKRVSEDKLKENLIKRFTNDYYSNNYIKMKIRFSKKKETLYNVKVINSILHVMDNHSSLLIKESLDEFATSMSKEGDVGFGFEVSKKDSSDFVLVRKIAPNSPVAKSKIIGAGDEIIKINGKSVKDLSLYDVDILLNEDKDIKAPVVLTIRSFIDKKEFPETFEIIDVPIVREIFDREKTASKIIKNTLYVELESFYSGCSDDIEKTIDLAKEKNKDLNGIVLDLRNNPGGQLDEVLKILHLFLGTRLVLQVDQSQEKDLYSYNNSGVSSYIPKYKDPLIILINKSSASASEIMAGVIKDYKRGLIIGDDHSFGKGSIQTVLDYTNYKLGLLKISINVYYLASGKSPQFDGITSDIIVPSMNKFDKTGEKYFKYSLKPKSKAPNKLGSVFDMNLNKKINILKKISSKRVSKNNDFNHFKNAESIHKWVELQESQMDFSDYVLDESLNILNDYVNLKD